MKVVEILLAVKNVVGLVSRILNLNRTRGRSSPNTAISISSSGSTTEGETGVPSIISSKRFKEFSTSVRHLLVEVFGSSPHVVLGIRATLGVHTVTLVLSDLHQTERSIVVAENVRVASRFLKSKGCEEDRGEVRLFTDSFEERDEGLAGFPHRVGGESVFDRNGRDVIDRYAFRRLLTTRNE